MLRPVCRAANDTPSAVLAYLAALDGGKVAPLVDMVRELSITGARTARETYGARGWVAHHNTDAWRATAPIDGAQWGPWPTGGAWLCTHLWDRMITAAKLRTFGRFTR